MALQDILDPIANEAGLDNADAEQVTRAFLETLATRLGNDEARQLATELPVELQDTLAPTDPEFQKGNTAQFVERFAEATGLSRSRAAFVAQVTWREITRRVSAAEVWDLKSQLTSGLNELLDGDPRPDNNS